MSDDLVERARTAAEKVYGTQFFNVEIEAAIAVVLEEAAKVADDEACHCEDTGSAPSDFGNAGRNDAALTIAAAIRALIKE